VIAQKQKLVQIYFALRHSFYQLRKFLLKVFLYSNPEPIHNNDHNILIKNIKQFGCDAINSNKLLEDSSALNNLILHANSLLKNQRDIQTIANKITDTKKDFKVTITDLFDHNQLVSIISDKNLIKIVRKYLGTEAYLNHSSVWWDHHLSEGPKDSQLFHIDGEDPIMLKVFFYLTDVSINDGPFTFIKKSNLFFNKLRMILIYGILGFSENNLGSSLSSKVKIFTGKAGDIVFADTNGFHKGGSIDVNSLGRILLTLTFVSRWPNAKPPHRSNTLLPFISCKKLLSGNFEYEK
jgi:hypothetical protein